MNSIDNQKSFLIDTTKCIACRACQVACKQWHNLPAEETTFFGREGGYQNPANMSGKTYTVIKFHEVKDKKGNLVDWVFKKDQCQHCLDPACESACIVGALKKTADGPVVWDTDKCIGCRYCMVACPYNIPKFEWSKAIPDIQKCDFCADRISEGLPPSCAKACPTGAITYGTRGELLEEARKRMKNNPDTYYQHIYGEHEAGGTNVLYLSKYPLEDMGYPKNISTNPFPAKTATAMHAIPGVVMGLSAVLGATAYVINKRIENENGHKED